LPKLKTPANFIYFYKYTIQATITMITKLNIKNFRGIGELELAPLTILLGGNNSGKSTILEALFLAPNPFRSVPYVIGGYKSAVGVIHAMHETLNSQGYAFLLYNYTANQAEIECKVDGEDYVLLFNKEDPDISVYTKKRGEEDSYWQGEYVHVFY